MGLVDKLKESLVAQIGAVVAVLLVTAGTGYVTGCWDFARRAYASVEIVQTHSQQIQEIQSSQQDISKAMSKQLEQILKEVQSVKREQVSQNVLTGLAIRLDCCQGDREPWVRVNALSPAIRFAEGDKLRITTRTREELTEDFVVKGTFRAENPQYLLQLNGLAAEVLRVGRATEIGVMVREVGE